MPDQVSSPLPTLPPIEPTDPGVPAQPTGNATEQAAPFKLPRGATSLRVTSGEVEFVVEGKRQMRRATKDSPVEVTLGVPLSVSDRERLKKELAQAQRDIVRNISEALKASMKRIGSGFLLTLVMNLTVFGIGIASFVMAVLKSLGHTTSTDVAVSATFGGLSVVAFLTIFISRPLAAVASSGPRTAWVLATVNTYWTKLVYMNENETVLEDLQSAQQEFESSMSKYLTTVNFLDRAKSDELVGPEDSDGPKKPDSASASS